MNDLDCAAAELILLCDMPKEAQQKLLRPIKIGVGDYIGSGYAFTDKFNKIYNEFTCNCFGVEPNAVKYYLKKYNLYQNLK